MDCNNCVCVLVCRDAQNSEHRENIRSGQVNCPDYFQRPDNVLERAIKAVSKIGIWSGIEQSIYVIEECSELIKELTKKQRGKGSDKDVIAEACDVLTAVCILLEQYGVSKEFISKQILYKCNRAIDRYHKNGEV